MNNLLKRFVDLSNFQQWVLFYIISNGKIQDNVTAEINNFCDKTKNSVDLNNFDKEMANLQKELEYFAEEGLLIRTSHSEFVLSAKGDLYCFQNLNQNLTKIRSQSVITKLSASSFYVTSRGLCDRLISNYTDLKSISQILISDPKDTMTRIQLFIELIRFLSTIPT